MASTGIAAACSRRVSSAAESPAPRRTACTAVPNRLVFSTSGMASRTRMAAIGWGVRTSTIGRPANTCFTSLVVPIVASRPAWISATRWQRSASSR